MQSGTRFLSILYQLVQDKADGQFDQLLMEIEKYVIDEEETTQGFRARDAKDPSSLYCKLDAHRSMLNPSHPDFLENTTLRHWYNCFEANPGDARIDQLNNTLMTWFGENRLIFAQNTFKKQMPNATFYVPLYGNNGIFAKKKQNEGETHQLSIGVLLIPPNYWYKPHYHPSHEVYFILNDSDSLWMADYDINAFKQPSSKWKSPGVGDLIYHPPNIHHSMKTRDKPLLALYIWWGDVQTASVFSKLETPSSIALQTSTADEKVLCPCPVLHNCQWTKAEIVVRPNSDTCPEVPVYVEKDLPQQYRCGILFVILCLFSLFLFLYFYKIFEFVST